MNEWNDRNQEVYPDFKTLFQDDGIQSSGARGASGNPRVPDVTRSVMGRLGYMKVSERVALRKRRRRNVGRVFAGVLAMALCGGGLLLHESGSEIRGPEGLTVPGALGQDLNRGQHQLIRAIRFIRNHAPIPAESDSPAEAPVEDPSPPYPEENTLAIGPVGWI